MTRKAAAYLLGLAMLSCGSEPEVPDGTARTAVRAPCTSGTSATQAPIDTGIAPIKGAATFSTAAAVRVAVALAETSLTQARVAEERAVAPEVKAYARAVIDERLAQLARLEPLVDRTHSQREDPTPGLLRTEMNRTRIDLESIERAGFDLPFMTAEVSLEARVLGLIDAALLPSAAQATATPGADGTERELDQELRAIRESYATRIIHALRVQGVLRAAQAGAGASGDLGGEGGADGPALPQ